MKKRIVSPLFITALVMALTSCSSGSNTSSSTTTGSTGTTGTTTGTTSSDGAAWGPDNPIELTAAVSVTEIQGDFNEIQILKDYAEESGIHVTYQNIPSSDRETQLSLLLNSGELPDMLFKMQVSSTDQAKYAEQGLFVPFSDYAELMPNLQRWFDEYPTAEEAVTMSDGKIYAAPYILAGDAIRCGHKIWYNSDVLEKLGMEMPTTTDEFYDYLVACKSLDYNGNGQADEIPLTCANVESIESRFFDSFGLMNHGSSHQHVYTDENDELQFAYTSTNYQELLRYMNKLYTEGLIDQDIFTMDYAQEIAKCTTGRALTFIMVNNSPVSNSPYEEFSVGQTEPLEGPNGDKMFTSYSMPASATGNLLITYTCKEKGEEYVQAAMTWMDHWYSDEGIISYFMGIEDVTYEADADSPGGYALTDMVMSDPDGRTFEQVLAEYVPWAGGANPSVATNEFFKGGETWPVCLTAVDGLRNYFPEDVWPSFTAYYSASEADQMGTIQTDLLAYRDEWRAYFMTGQKDVDSDWDEYVAGYSGMNLDGYMEIYRKGYEGYLAAQ